MKTLISTTIFILISALGYCQYFTLQQCKDMYYDSRYSEIIPSLENQDSVVYVKNSFTINLMLGSSLCKTGNKDRGRRVLNWITSKYDLDPVQLGIINEEISNCNPSNLHPVKINALALWYNRNSNAGVKSKIIDFNPKPNEVSSTSSSRFIDTSLFKECPLRIKKRDLIIQNEDLPKNRLLIPNFYRSQHFLLFGDTRKTSDSLKTISKELERTLEFYESYFQLNLPDNYINVYALSSYNSLLQFAEVYHRIRLEENTVGYTFELDCSISGYLPTNPAGTLKHELLHLLLHQNFQAVPPWMDEGLSALYEVSGFDANDKILYGWNNWRGPVLRKHMDLVHAPKYSLERILTDYSWKNANNKDEFNQADQILINAISRYFFLFLQESKLLQRYILAVKDYSPDDSNRFFIEELQKVSEDSINIFENKFYSWLHHKVS